MTFKVGDRVRCITDADDNEETRNRLGTVRVVGPVWITVEFDENVNGHAGGGWHIEYGHAWDCRPEDLELERPTGVTHGAGSIGEFFKKLEAQACTSGYCSLQSS